MRPPIALLITSAMMIVLATAGPAAAQAPPPPCKAGTPQAIEFDGLPGRAPYGPSTVFTASERLVDWTPEGEPAIRMTGVRDRDVFFEGSVALDDELFLRLDLDDGPVSVTATYAQRNAVAERTGAAPMDSTLCTQTLSKTVRGYRHIQLGSFCGGSNYRPRMFVIACGDAGYVLGKLRWRRWNRATAQAVGTARVNDCIPACVAGTYHEYRVTLSAYRIRRCPADDDRYRYTRLRMHYPGARPPGEPATTVLTPRCSA